MENIIDSLITDRTQNDVDRVRELKNKILKNGLGSLTNNEFEEYIAGMRGAYNATDLNRVGEASNYVYSLLDSFGLRPKNYKTQKTDWSVYDVPTQTQMELYISNIRILRDTLGGTLTLPESMNYLTFENANRIERVLVAAEESALEYEKTMYFCGELYCGEVDE